MSTGGGDDLTENWAVEEVSNKSRKRKANTESEGTSRTTTTAKKRQRDGHNSASRSSPPSSSPLASIASSSPSPALSSSAVSSSSSLPLPFLSRAEQAQRFWPLYAANRGSMTDIERADQLTEKEFVQPSDHDGGRSSPASQPSSHALSSLPSHLRRVVPQWKKTLCAPPSPSSNSRPFLLILCSSALRCLDFVKASRGLHLHPNGLVKAFARHIKRGEQRHQLVNNDVRVVVGTARRVMDLLDEGALSLDRLSVVLIDGAEDVKRYTALTLPGVREDMFTLYQRYLHSRVKQGDTKLCLY